MRRAVQIAALVLMVVLFLQSCAVAVGGGLAEDLSRGAENKAEAEDLAGAGAVGVLAAFLWLFGGAFVMSRPKISVWLFGIAAVLCLLGAGSGFSDLYIWAAFSALFAFLSWRGTKEKEKEDAEANAGYEADVEAAAARRASERGSP